MKSKQQKQEEALERKRAAIPQKREQYLSTTKGGEIYQWNVKFYGREEADKQAFLAMKKFQAACREARVDEHGNPQEHLKTVIKEQGLQEEQSRQQRRLEKTTMMSWNEYMAIEPSRARS